MNDVAVSFLHFLLDNSLYETSISIIFSFILVAAYYFFWSRSNIKSLRNKHEKEVSDLKNQLYEKYETEIRELNKKNSDKTEEINKLNHQITRLENRLIVSDLNTQRQYFKEDRQ